MKTLTALITIVMMIIIGWITHTCLIMGRDNTIIIVSMVLLVGGREVALRLVQGTDEDEEENKQDKNGSGLVRLLTEPYFPVFRMKNGKTFLGYLITG